MTELQNCPFCTAPHPVSSIFQKLNFPISHYLFKPTNFNPSRISTDKASSSLKEKMDEQSSKILKLSSEVQDLADLLQEKYLELRFAEKDSELNRQVLKDLAASFVGVSNEF